MSITPPILGYALVQVPDLFFAIIDIIGKHFHENTGQRNQKKKLENKSPDLG